MYNFDASKLTVYGITDRRANDEHVFVGSTAGHVTAHMTLKGTDIDIRVQHLDDTPGRVTVFLNGVGIQLGITLTAEAVVDGDAGLTVARSLRNAINRAIESLEERAPRPA